MGVSFSPIKTPCSTRQKGFGSGTCQPLKSLPLKIGFKSVSPARLANAPSRVMPASEDTSNKADRRGCRGFFNKFINLALWRRADVERCRQYGGTGWTCKPPLSRYSPIVYKDTATTVGADR